MIVYINNYQNIYYKQYGMLLLFCYTSDYKSRLIKLQLLPLMYVYKLYFYEVNQVS